MPLVSNSYDLYGLLAEWTGPSSCDATHAGDSGSSQREDDVAVRDHYAAFNIPGRRPQT
jgi:hypothetical protein